MSGIAAIAWQDSQEAACAASSDLDLLLAALAHRGTPARSPVLSRTGNATAQPAGRGAVLGAALQSLTPESAGEVQPITDPASGCVLVWDGRLDNRAELLAQMSAHGNGAPRLAPSASDAQIVLHSYLQSGEDCAGRLLGDFAFALWDPRAQRLFAARDFLGVRPLFYSCCDGRIFLASEIQALLRLTQIPREFDEVSVSEALLWWTGFPDVERTFHSAIRRLPPAHALTWDALGLALRRYWQIEPRRVLRYPRHQDYADHLGALLTEAVSCRLRSAKPAGIFLSGGLDSSAVALVAARHPGPCPGLHSIHLQLTDENDEIELARLVARQGGIPFHHQPLPAGDVLPEVEEIIRTTGLPFTKLDLGNDRLLVEMAREQGCAVILTGDASDELSGHPGAFVADLIRHARIRKMVRDLPTYAKYFDGTLSLAFREAMPYLAPRPALRLWRGLKWRRAPAWIHPDLARRTHLAERMRSVRPRLPFEALSTEEDFHSLTRGRRVLMDEWRDLVASRQGLDYWKPFYDRRLVEYMMAVPWEEKVVDGRFKSLLREIPGLLPEPLRNLRRKANYDPYYSALPRKQHWNSWRPLFDNPPETAANFLDLRAAREVSRAFLDRADWSQQNLFLHLGGFLLWLRSQSQVKL